MLVDRKKGHFAFGALLLSAIVLGGCSMPLADLPGIGMPADAPARPKEIGAYLPVHDMPPERDQAALAPAEQAKIERELIEARDRQVSPSARREAATK